MNKSELRQLIKEEISKALNENSNSFKEESIPNVVIPKSLVSRYVNMKGLFGDKAKDPMVKAKLIPIITDYFPKNLDKSYQDLKNKFGNETASQVVTVLFGAYIDGYLDHFKNPITRLFKERNKFPSSKQIK